jgi:hypothetical protein
LAPTNKEVNKLNDIIIKKFKSNSKERIYLSIDKLENESSHLNISLEELNLINHSSLPAHELRLKTGLIIMIIRNLKKKRLYL